MTELALYLLLTIPVAITGFCYSYILTRPGQILSKPYGWLVTNTPEWLHYPIIYCEKCTSGQMAFWLYPFWIAHFKGNIPLSFKGDSRLLWDFQGRFPLEYDIPSHIGFVLITIYIVGFVKQAYLKIVQEEPYQPRKKKVNTPSELL